MYKGMFVTLLAAALLAAPLPPHSSAAFAQQTEASAGQLAAREREKKCAAEWK